MHLLNNINVYLNSIDENIGNSLGEIPILDVYDSRQSTAYYDGGIYEFDAKFDKNKFYQLGYAFTIIAYPNCLGLFFLKYSGDTLQDMGCAYINRNSILKVEEFDAKGLEVVKRKESANLAKYMVRNKAGLLGSALGYGMDKLKKVNIDVVNGKGYKLSYLDSNNIEKSINIYSSDEFKNTTSLFLNTYYKSKLDPAALITPKANTGCFIATACYRDLYSKEVVFFRLYRDEKLKKSLLGRLFIQFYYATSPYIYSFLLNTPSLSNRLKLILDLVYKGLK